MLVAINAGHCPGLDAGACGNYSEEANIVKSVAEVVCEDLNQIGIQAIFIQENELEDICDIANGANADLFVSIHCNAASPEAHGTETFYCSGSENGRQLAQCIQDQLIGTLGTTDRGLKTNSLYVTKHTNMPAVLTELAFISNPDEEELLNNNINEMAHAIARGVTDYMCTK